MAPRADLATVEDIRRLCGDVQDWKIAAVLARQATLADLEEAVAWQAGLDDEMGAERKSLEGSVAELYDILTADEPSDDDRR
jgi:hypothetical protein